MLTAAAANEGNLQSLLGEPDQVAEIGDTSHSSRISSRISTITESMNDTGTVVGRTTVTIEMFS